MLGTGAYVLGFCIGSLRAVSLVCSGDGVVCSTEKHPERHRATVFCGLAPFGLSWIVCNIATCRQLR